MDKERKIEFKSSSLNASITKTTEGDVLLTMMSNNGYGGAIIMKRGMLHKFSEALGWAKSNIETM